jgi:hypothetical protein
MRWPSWLPWNHQIIEADDGLDIAHVLAEGLRDLPSARTALATLSSERKRLVSRKKAVNKSLKKVTKWDSYRISRSSLGSPDFGAAQLSQAMRDANVSGEAENLRREQLAAIDGKIQEIDRALANLVAFTKKAH